MSSVLEARLEALAADVDIEFDFLLLCVREGAVREEELAQEPPTPAALARLRRLQRLCRGLDVDVFAGSIIVDLLERLDARRDFERRRGSED